MKYKAMLMDVKRFAIHDGPGIRTTLFLKGCPLKCVWCHNPEGIWPKPQMAYYLHKCIDCGECVSVCPTGAQTMTEEGRHSFDRERCIACGACAEVCLGEAMLRYGRTVDLEQALAIALEDAAFYGSTGGVTVSGGEPLLQAEFVAELLTALKARGIHTAVDTCGCVPWEKVEKVLPCTDMFLYDIKHMDPRQHRQLTGRSNERILSNLIRLSELGARIEVRFPMVPGCNDDMEQIAQMGVFLSGLHIERVKVLAYHSMARAKYAALGAEDTMPRVDTPTSDEMRAAVEQLRQMGVNAVSG
ncbi:MAG: glycyl-radical enzyme activating protein [Oscillospiraceae bacterium]|nr:glycyl-radical enzyme activating protein [Oscillospiraceae bacterium]